MAEPKTRIYEVFVSLNGDFASPQSFLVEAQSQGQAWDHVAKKYVQKVVLPSGKRIAQLMKSGVPVEEIKARAE